MRRSKYEPEFEGVNNLKQIAVEYQPGSLFVYGTLTGWPFHSQFFWSKFDDFWLKKSIFERKLTVFWSKIDVFDQNTSIFDKKTANLPSKMVKF